MLYYNKMAIDRITMAANSAFTSHNHQHCIEDALNTAARLCSDNGARLTPLRAQVLQLVWRSHKPLGAYALMDLLKQAQAEQGGNTKSVAPPTVYRALDFLLEQGLVHRLNSLNAFIGCCEPNQKHSGQFFICSSCDNTEEILSPPLTKAINYTAKSAGFTVEHEVIEIVGLCPACQE
ncbi:MAG: Fur family zinc uptake transcriptional regulator [Porticoccus sp.]|jgi:Fur family zinc uptake transcriptional regulator